MVILLDCVAYLICVCLCTSTLLYCLIYKISTKEFEYSITSVNLHNTGILHLLRDFRYFNWCQTKSVKMADVELEEDGFDIRDNGPQAAPEQSGQRQPEDQQRSPDKNEEQADQGGVRPETVVPPPSIEDVGEDHQADQTVYEDRDTEEIFTQQDAPACKETSTAHDKTPTNKKIGALKTNFIPNVERLMNDPALRNALKESTDEDLEKARRSSGMTSTRGSSLNSRTLASRAKNFNEP